MESINIEKAQGYVWWSDREEPKTYNNEAVNLSLDESGNPFIVEGQLFDVDKKESYSIRYVDGKYYVKTTLVADADYQSPNEIKTYFPNRMDNLKLKFLRYWQPVKDENCLDMEVLTLTKNVFIGFEN